MRRNAGGAAQRAAGEPVKKLLCTAVAVAVMVFGLTFTFLNSQPVEIQYYPGAHWKGPLSILLFVTWVLVGYLLSPLSSLQGASGASAGQEGV